MKFSIEFFSDRMPQFVPFLSTDGQACADINLCHVPRSDWKLLRMSCDSQSGCDFMYYLAHEKQHFEIQQFAGLIQGKSAALLSIAERCHAAGFRVIHFHKKGHVIDGLWEFD